MASHWDIIVPTATTNLCTNPSFEADAIDATPTGWATGGTNTIDAKNEQAKFGGQSMLCTYQDSTTLAAYAVSGLSATTAYRLTGWVYVPTGWDGGDIRLSRSGFTDGSLSDLTEYTDGTDSLDTWIYLEATFTTAIDVAGNWLLLTTSAPSAGTTAYLDGFQYEQKTYSTTYCDGDQPGCVWNGTAHASTSTRDALEPSGGVVKNFADDLDFHIASDRGTGMVNVNNIESPLALQPGGLYEGQTYNSRPFVFNGTIIGSTVANFHSKKQTLIKAVNPNTVKINEKSKQRTLRYTGATVNKEIQAAYDAGLENGLPIGWTEENIDLRFHATDPMFYQIGESAAALDVNDTSTMRLAAGKESGVWNNMGLAAATIENAIYAMEFGPDGLLYIGGDFTDLDGVANCDYIATYDPADQTVAALSTGLNDIVRALAFGPDGTLYVGGDFLNAGGDADADRFAQWNGSAFSAVSGVILGSFGASVRAIAVSSTGVIYVGGDFTTVGAGAFTYLAEFTTNWAAPNGLGGAPSAAVYALAATKDNKIYLGGNFATVDSDANKSYIAAWNDTTDAWETLSSGVNGLVRCLWLDDNGDLYIGGDFTNAGGDANADSLAVFNGTEFVSVGNVAVGGQVHSIHKDDSDVLHIGGTFTNVDSVIGADYTAQFVGNKWAAHDIDMAGPPTVYSIASKGDGLYFGFDSAGSGQMAGSTSISYFGTAPAYPYIKIKRSGGTRASLVNITNHTTGAVLYFNYLFKDGEEWTIDTRPGQQTITSSHFGNQYANMSPTSDLGEFFLLPPNTGSSQTNTITAFVNITGAPTMTANMIWRDTYLSQD